MHFGVRLVKDDKMRGRVLHKVKIKPKELYFSDTKGFVNEFSEYSKCPFFRDKIIDSKTCRSCKMTYCPIRNILFPELNEIYM